MELCRTRLEKRCKAEAEAIEEDEEEEDPFSSEPNGSAATVGEKGCSQREREREKERQQKKSWRNAEWQMVMKRQERDYKKKNDNDYRESIKIKTEANLFDRQKKTR